MHFNSKNGRLTLTKREQQTLADAHRILSDAGRILGNEEIVKIGDGVETAMAELAPKESP